ncbi:SoxW family protein [Azonexus sp. IMCC34842]|uniref:SoxW family protein n=1 Tax=Azonexus sp. IMCC34842 TaxID=3420950 RepID=UPI003D11C6BA
MAGSRSTVRNTLARLLLLSGLALHSLTAGALDTSLPAAIDLRAESEQAGRQNGPLIILFSRRDCKYCETVRRDYLLPLTTSAGYRNRVVVRQINQDSDAVLINFRGETTTHARFANSEKIKLVPVVAFYGRNGKQLAEPIIGTRLPDFYQGYLDDAIEKSASALRGR